MKICLLEWRVLGIEMDKMSNEMDFGKENIDLIVLSSNFSLCAKMKQ